MVLQKRKDFQKNHLLNLSQKKSRKKTILKTKMINSFIKNGKKNTGEKILLKFVKFLQKSTSKNCINFMKLGIINSTPIFKLNEQIVKKGKRKVTKITPAFIPTNSLRVMISLKFINKIVSKNSDFFYKSFGQEVIASAHFKSLSIDKRDELQKQVLINKRYISKFKW